MKKNTGSQSIGAQMITAADGTAFTNPVLVYVTGDGGTQALGTTGTPVGAATHEGQGYHSYAPAQAETNFDHIAFTFTTTSAIPATIQVYTSFPQTIDNPTVAAIQAGLATYSASALILERLPSALVSGRIDASIGAAAANTLTASALAADAVTEIQAGLATYSGVATILERLPAALVSGRIDASVGAMAANVLTATAIDADAITDAKVASDVTIASVGTVSGGVAGNVTGNVVGSVGSVVGAVGSVTGAVGSVTGNVGGNVVGSVATVSGGVGGNVTGSVGSVVGNVGGSVGSVTGAVGSVAGNVDGNVSGSVATVSGGLAQRVDSISNIRRNQALAKFAFVMLDTAGNATTSKTVTCTRSIDGAAYAVGTLANVAEVASGSYTVDFGAGDLNGKMIILLAQADGCKHTYERIITVP